MEPGGEQENNLTFLSSLILSCSGDRDEIIFTENYIRYGPQSLEGHAVSGKPGPFSVCQPHSKHA